MNDAMLDVLYDRVFQTKREAESLNVTGSDDRRRQVVHALNKQLSELIGIRTQQLRDGR